MTWRDTDRDWTTVSATAWVAQSLRTTSNLASSRKRGLPRKAPWPVWTSNLRRERIKISANGSDVVRPSGSTFKFGRAQPTRGLVSALAVALAVGVHVGAREVARAGPVDEEEGALLEQEKDADAAAADPGVAGADALAVRAESGAADEADGGVLAGRAGAQVRVELRVRAGQVHERGPGRLVGVALRRAARGVAAVGPARRRARVAGPRLDDAGDGRVGEGRV